MVAVLLVALFALLYFTCNSAIMPDKTFISIAQSVENGNWQEAANEFGSFKSKWNSYKYLIELNNGEQNFSRLKETVIRLDAAIQSKSQKDAKEYLTLIMEDLKNIIKVVPEP